ncbi:hypothetical protein, partial [Burkholderia ubonensis]|uniref:hypothetical protein n=1 Tax=Burkholderia ubonensis TaxID=101571 RepID=UPI001E2F1AD7
MPTQLLIKRFSRNDLVALGSGRAVQKKAVSNRYSSIRETLINRRSREVVGEVGGEWPDTEA